LCRRSAWSKKIRDFTKAAVEEMATGWGKDGMVLMFRESWTRTTLQNVCGGDSLSVYGQVPLEMYGAWYNGILDALRLDAVSFLDTMVVIDGWYIVGGFADGDVSIGLFNKLWNVYKPVDSNCVAVTPCSSTQGSTTSGVQSCGVAYSTNPYTDLKGVGYVADINKATYASRMKFGFAAHWDGDNGEPWYNTLGTVSGGVYGVKSNCNLNNPTYDCNNVTPSMLKTWLTNCMSPKFNAYSCWGWENTNNAQVGEFTVKFLLPTGGHNGVGVHQHYLDRMNEVQ
jgi:hypothetical protein